MGSVSKYISSKFESYVIGVIEKRFGDNREAPFYSPAGIDSVPLPDDKMFISEKDGSGKYVILGSLMISKGAKEGELILYSRDSNGSVKSKLYLNKTGEIVLNDGTGFAVEFNNLKAEFDKLNSAFNGHTHIYSPGPSPPVTTATPVPQSSAVIDNTKVDKVRI